MSELARIDPTLGDELFAELKGTAAISFDELTELEDGGAAFVAELNAYVEAHPKLDVVYLTKRSVFGDELVVRWRWRP